MKSVIFIAAAVCCVFLCSCANNTPVEESGAKISITSAGGNKAPVVTVKMSAVSQSSRPDGAQEKIQPLPIVLPKPATAASDGKDFL